MSGSKMTTQRKTILAAVKKAPPGGDYAWDGKDDDDRPLTEKKCKKVLRHTARNAGAPSAQGAGERPVQPGSPVLLPLDRRRLADPHGCGFATPGQKVS